MADNEDNKDEYQFAELDPLSVSAEESTEPASEAFQSQAPKDRPDIKRVALVLIVVIVFALIAYKVVHSFLLEKKEASVPSAVPTAQVAVPSPAPAVQPEPIPAPAAPSAAVPEDSSVPAVDDGGDTTTASDTVQKVSALEMGQENLRTDLISVGNQVNGLETGVSEVAAKVAQLTQVVDQLRMQLEEQSRAMQPLIVRFQAERKRAARRAPVHHMVYYIQALIPGRAWLVAENGSTVTVREGSPLSGYGTIKLIDPMQGLVATSSGKMIRFNQNDS